MAPAIEPAKPEADTAPAAARRRSSARTLGIRRMIIVGGVVALVRWWFSSDRRTFHVAPDEPAQLAMARWLAGGVRWNMFDHSTWRPGFATLISPLYWFTDDGAMIVRGALTVNALLGGAAAVVLARLACRITELAPPLCAAIAVVVALSPTALSGSAFVWAEALVALAFVTTVWFLVRFVEEGTIGPAFAAVATSIVGFTAHSRLVVMIPVALIVTTWVLACQRRWRPAAAVVAFGIVGTALSQAYASHVFDAVWDDPSQINTVGAVLHRLDQPLDIADALVGQIWYQQVATLGLAVIGAAFVARAARPGAAHSTLAPPAARVVMLATAAPVLLSAVFMAGRERPDQLVYGRYDDAVMWPMLVIALAWIVGGIRDGFERRHLRVVLGSALVLAVSSVMVQALHGDVLDRHTGVRPMVPGLLAYIGVRDGVMVVRVTMIALVLMGVIAAMIALPRRALHRGIMLVALAIALSTFSGVRTHGVLAVQLNSWSRAAAVREIETLVPADATLGVRMVPNALRPPLSWDRQRQRYQLYQLYLPHHRFVRDRGTGDTVGPYVFAPTDDPAMRAANATPIWTDPGAEMTLWAVPMSTSTVDGS